MMNDLRKVAQEQSTDTKSAIRGTRMSEAATPAVAAGNRVSTTRIVGATAIAVAALVLIDNVVVGWVDSPTYGAPLKEVLAFHADHRAAVAIAVGLEALNVPLLLLFVTGLHGLVAPRGGRWRDSLGGDGVLRRSVGRRRAVRRGAHRAEPGVGARLANACSSVRAVAARARGDLHRRGVGHPRQRFDAAVAAAAGRGERQLAHLGRGRKPRHRGWPATAVRRACGLGCVARLARCHRPTAHPWTGLTSLYGGARCSERKEVAMGAGVKAAEHAPSPVER